MKKIILILILTMCMAISLYGCEENKKKKVAKKPVNIEYVAPQSQTGKKYDDKIESLQKLLSKELKAPVNIQRTTSDYKMIEDLASKKMDVAIMSPVTYTIGRDKGTVDVLLKSKDYLVDDKGNQTKKLGDYYRSQIVVKKDSDIKKLKDLKGKKVGLQDADSAAGYIYPLADLQREHIPKSALRVSQFKDEDQALKTLLDGDIDAVATYDDARVELKKSKPNVYKDTRVIYTSDKIPNDTISVRVDLSDEWRNKIAKAFINVSKKKEGRQLIHDLFDHEGYEKTSEADFKKVRDNRILIDG
ncbi:phosphate/phosphite/phosphonate ABC transporter substrate-binding protein [Staphylococcus lugdunensis]|uniref:Phosphate/phosphite/phosphonate ABC transporter substrate-binding protein n=2 Tax=Staphylococcus lugdunensis TaxID=28035 RepID=A0A292DHG1_STALU|nr:MULTISPECIES: phosphate/phosphite/phosphonate ABC transporter substrate-binding protein [Staphylococcus]ADC88596.1 Phosphonate ABC transporter phosphate-binding periplasmic component [Staphylococcus lugdunensis HKU09-01]AMG61636.1 phosphonate ABC transporter substrate-binding protein [Staphylococcus lugdunensis]ARJ07900.1 phosphonate ABC transporter substrate-binding protein [Staphylococcus lugdunensis]ARJ12460.1 phosphonate ABC transporter substrate-binding protein [Staphylococcus lugdunens